MANMRKGYGVKALVLNGGKILVLQKPNIEWDLPGGRVEEGEKPGEALRREISEELSLMEVEILVPVASWSFLKEPGFLITGTTWACRYLGGRIRLSGEHVGFGWVKGYNLRSLNLFSRFGLKNFRTWTNPGPPKIDEITRQDHFQKNPLKGVEKIVPENRSWLLC